MSEEVLGKVDGEVERAYSEYPLARLMFCSAASFAVSNFFRIFSPGPQDGIAV